MADVTETILENIKTAVNGIDGTGSYNVNLITVERRLKHWATMNNSEFPAAFILYEGESFAPSTMVRNQFSDFTVSIVCFLHISDGVLETQITNLREDVLRALFTDITRGGNAIDTQPVRTNAVVAWDGQEFTVGILEFTFLIKFEFSETNP